MQRAKRSDTPGHACIPCLCVWTTLTVSLYVKYWLLPFKAIHHWVEVHRSLYCSSIGDGVRLPQLIVIDQVADQVVLL
jgi:hypothetical protein